MIVVRKVSFLPPIEGAGFMDFVAWLFDLPIVPRLFNIYTKILILIGRRLVGASRIR